MALPEYFKEELKQRCEIGEIISSYVILKRRGKNLVGLCPFHNEKTPSFVVYPENGSFYCFGCNTGRRCDFLCGTCREFGLHRSSPFPCSSAQDLQYRRTAWTIPCQSFGRAFWRLTGRPPDSSTVRSLSLRAGRVWST